MSVVEEAFSLSRVWDALRHPRDRRGRWRDVLGRMAGMGINAHVVGGSVRDDLLGREPNDHDILAAGHDHASIRAAVAKHGRVEDLTVAGRHVGVRLYPHGENFHIEITPPRKEVSTGPGHKDFEIVADPTVSVADDLARRDFTVNAMARNLDTGELVDPHGGQQDLENGVLRTVTPDSFRDDPLRIVRGIRFTSQLGLKPDDQTRAQMTEHADGIDHLSGERIGEQMDKLLMGEHPAEALRLARDTGVLHHVYPELAPTFGFGQESKYHGLTADEHTFEVVQSLANAGAPLHVRMAGLFHDSGKPEAAFRGEDGRLHYYGNAETGHSAHETVGVRKWLAVAKRHHYDSDTRDKVAALVNSHMFQGYSQPTDIRARRFLRDHGQERALDLITLKRADLAGKEAGSDEAVSNSHAKLHEFERRVREQIAAGHATHRSHLQINGADLKALGYPEDKRMGAALDSLLDQVIGQPDLNRRDWLLSQAQRMLKKLPDAKRDLGTLARDVSYTGGVKTKADPGTGFTREKRADGLYTYRHAADPRFTIVPQATQGHHGAHQPIFGRTFSEGNARVTGWHVEIEGSKKMFSPGKLADAKASVADPAWREWALSRIESKADPGTRKPPEQPLGPNGPTFHDFRPGDRVKTLDRYGGRTGVIVQRAAHKRNGWVVRWDNPQFGVTEGNALWPNLEPVPGAKLPAALKIDRVDEDTRNVTFPDGVTVKVMRGWKRNGGWGWVGVNVNTTFRSIRDAARAQRRAAERAAERAK